MDASAADCNVNATQDATSSEVPVCVTEEPQLPDGVREEEVTTSCVWVWKRKL